jgi:outer membrane lipoprotein-sorting protein
MLWLAALPLLAAGCAVSKKRVVPPAQVRPALDATADQLIAQYNQQARAVRSLNAAVELTPVAGSAYTGVIEEYHDVRGFILAQRPAHIRMIGQAPVVAKNVFDMVSDGETFRIFIPSKNKFIVGRAAFERPAKKPIENLRPQHLLDALFWSELPADQPVLFEELNADPARYYVLTVLRGSAPLEIARKIWFDRADLSLARIQLYGPGGRLLADIGYADWQPVAGVRYPRQISLARPHDDYRLGVRITTLKLNEDIAADRFRLDQPPGTELVRVGEGDTAVRP